MANYTKEEQFDLIRRNLENLRIIENLDKEVWLEAVEMSKRAIKYIENPTEEMKLEAVMYYGDAIKYIENPSKEIKIAAVKRNGGAIEYIENPTEEMKLEAVKNFGWAIQYIQEADNEVYFYALLRILKYFDYIEVDYENLKIKNAIFFVTNRNLGDYFEYYNGVDELSLDDFDNRISLIIDTDIFNKLKNYLLKFNDNNCFIMDATVDLKVIKELVVSDNTFFYITHRDDYKIAHLYENLANRVISTSDLVLW